MFMNGAEDKGNQLDDLLIERHSNLIKLGADAAAGLLQVSCKLCLKCSFVPLFNCEFTLDINWFH